MKDFWLQFARVSAGLWFLGALVLPGARAAIQPAAGFQKFVDDLPIPTVIQARSGEEITITMKQAILQLHRDLPPQPAFTYNGEFPGPIIEVESGAPLRVRWRNELPDKHLFPSPEGSMKLEGAPEVRAVVHLHGAVTPQANITDRFHNNDGWPDLWITRGQEQIADYPNPQDARILWYHDHAVGDTGRNVAAGLAGMYLIHDSLERSLNLPSGKYELPLILQTHGMNADGSRFYTEKAGLEFYGNSVSVNGKLWPRLKVEPRKYRFRILNAANARSFALKILDETTEGDGPPIHQIASEAGFLAETVVLNDPSNPESPRLTLSPSERADVIVDFSAYAGHVLLVQNNSLDPGDGEMPIPQILRVEVSLPLSAPDTSSLPKAIRALPRMPEANAQATRKIIFSRMMMANGMFMTTLNGASWTDPVTERPLLGSTEIWELVNPLPDAHPFHVHLVQFQVLDRRPFDAKRFEKDGTMRYLGEAEAPDLNETGWKDVVRVAPKSVTRIIMKFEPFTGHYVYHCHILEHEDMDMMRPFEVIGP